MDSAELSAEEEEVLLAVMREGGDQADRRTASQARDLEEYELRVYEAGSSRSVQLDQESIPEALGPVLARLKQKAGPRPLDP